MTTREWTHIGRSEQAFEDFRANQGAGAQYATGFSRGEQPVEIEVVLQLTRDGARFRQQTEGSARTATTVCDGERTWTWDASTGAVVYDSAEMTTTESDLLDPVGLVTGFQLEPLGATEVAGRRAVRVHAVPRSHEWRMSALGLGAEEIELAVDAECGVILRAEARHKGQAFHVLEVLDIQFDGELPPETFVFEPPAGETVRLAGEVYRFDQLPIEEVAARASFAVWVPGGLAPSWRLHAIHRPVSQRPALPESVHLLFFDDALHSFSIEEAGERLLAWRVGEPRVVERDGVELRVLGGKPLEVHGERAGTHFRLSSDTLDADALVELAAAFVAAPTEPPSLF